MRKQIRRDIIGEIEIETEDFFPVSEFEPDLLLDVFEKRGKSIAASRDVLKLLEEKTREVFDRRLLAISEMRRLLSNCDETDHAVCFQIKSEPMDFGERLYDLRISVYQDREETDEEAETRERYDTIRLENERSRLIREREAANKRLAEIETELGAFDAS